MKKHSTSRAAIFAWLISVLLLAAACQAGAVTTSPTLEPPEQPSAVPAIPVTATPTQPAAEPPSGISVDYSAVAQNATVETLAAQPGNIGAPYVDIAVEYRRLTLEDYPIADHAFKPQIFIFPAGDMASADERAGKIAANLQDLLQTQQAGDQLPFLPQVFSTKQALDVQVQYLDFKSGKGVRFLTQFNNGMSPINNHAVVYTFQGLTGDGKYYVSAILPVTHPDLPATSDISGKADVLNDYPGYIAKLVNLLNQQPAGSFTPGLEQLDALVRSIEVK